MNAPKQFTEYLSNGVVRKREPDKARGKALREDAIARAKFQEQILSKVELNDENANIIISGIYDVLIALIRAKLFETGYHATGFGAHEAEVSSLRSFNFAEADVVFMNGIRDARNQILYYGQKYDETYARQTIAFYHKIFPILKQL